MINYSNDIRELENFKKIDLVGYLVKKGWKIDVNDSDKKQGGFTALRKEPDSKIIVKNKDGWFYSDRRAGKGGSIIDYLQQYENLNLGQVRKQLRQVNHSFPPRPIKTYQKAKTVNFDRELIIKKWNAIKSIQNYNYLHHRNIPDHIQDQDRFLGKFKSSTSGVIFPYYDKGGICGYERNSKNFKKFSTGGKKGLWFTTNIKTCSTILLCESVIDCFSHATLDPKSGNIGYVATGGTMSQLSEQLLILLLVRAEERKQHIIIAVDNDKAGDDMANRIQVIANLKLRRIKPASKDWNNDLTNQCF